MPIATAGVAKSEFNQHMNTAAAAMERGNQPNHKNGVFMFLKSSTASKQKTRTNVGNASARWRQLRAEKGIKTEQELANSLRQLVFHLPYVNV